LSGLEYVVVSLVCLLFSNWATWRAGMKRGIEGTLEHLHKNGIFEYLENGEDTI